MGKYINPRDCSKEQWLNANGKILTDEAAVAFQFTGETLPVCWVNNGVFTAAGIAYDERERDEFAIGFTRGTDYREHVWFEVEKSLLGAWL